MYDAAEDDFNTPFVKKLMPGVPACVVNLSYRLQGFYVREGNPKGITGWDDLRRGDISVVNRRPGSGSRILLDGMLLKRGIAPAGVRGYDTVLKSHLAAAACIAEGSADLAIGTARIAGQIDGLDFIPLLKERMDLVIRRDSFSADAVSVMLEVLGSAAFKKFFSVFSGNDYRDTGKIIAEI